MVGSLFSNQDALTMKKQCGPVHKWLTAFLLSPGMLFASAYLLLWLSVNIYLDRTFKQNLKHFIISETGSRYQLDIGSLRPALNLNSITLKHLELIPVGMIENQHSNPAVRKIAELRIECPDLGFIPFKPVEEILSMHMVSSKILAGIGQ